MTRRMKWFKHIQRMERDILLLGTLEWNTTEQYANALKAVGGQENSWLHQLQNDCKIQF